MTSALEVLAPEGYSEAQIRRHSPDWIGARVEAAVQRRKTDLANHGALTALAVSAGMGAEEAISQLNATLSELSGVIDEDTAWLLNRDATPDLDALQRAGVIKPPREASQ